MHRWPHSVHMQVCVSVPGVMCALQVCMSARSPGERLIYIYIYAFSRRFYPKRLTLHSSYSYLLSLGFEPMILTLLAPCSTSWATGKLNGLKLARKKMKLIYFSDDTTLPRLCKWKFLCQLWSVQLAYRQTWCVVIWSHLCILRVREIEREHGDSHTPFVTLCFT